jgi:Protein of unknown function (DUF2384)
MARKPKKRTQRNRRPTRPTPSPADGIRLVTSEGAPLVFASASYRHVDLDGIRQVLDAAADFDSHDADETAQTSRSYIWLQSEGASSLYAPAVGRRILATLTLTPTTLDIEAMSKERLADCRNRLENLLGDRIQLEKSTARSVAQALRETPLQTKPTESVQPPPELIAQIEETLLKRWISEPIPALGGQTPIQAVKTPNGRKLVLELIAGAEQLQRAYKSPTGFAPDYRKAKRMLGLE